MSDLEEALAFHIKAVGLPTPLREYRFTLRRWKFDFAWLEPKIAVEVEGGSWVNGRHSRGEGFANDCRKLNAAALLGWRVFRFTGEMISDGYAVTTIEQALKMTT